MFDLSHRTIKENDETQTIWTSMKDMVNFNLMTKPTFILFSTSSFFSMLGYFIPLFYIPGMAVSRGVERTNANFLLSISGKIVITFKLYFLPHLTKAETRLLIHYH